MGVIVKQRPGKGDAYWVVVNHRGQRHSLKIGEKKAAQAVKLQLEAELALGNLDCLNRDKKTATKDNEKTFAEYAAECENLNPTDAKLTTIDTYRDNRKRYILPRFGHRKLSSITRDEIKNQWLSQLKAQGLSKGTIKLALASLRGILSVAVEDGLIPSNPASKVARFKKTERVHKGKAMEEEEVERFLEAACADKYYEFFLIALQAGLREGEVLALRWNHLHFGRDENDRKRYIHVEKRWYKKRGRASYDSPKGGEERNVEMSLPLQRALLELRDQRMLEAFQQGRETVADDLVFPAPTDGSRPVSVSALTDYHFKPTLKRAGLGSYRIHDLRHTYGSLLIQAGLPLPYVKEQMGHASIQVTVDTYWSLIGQRNVGEVDKALGKLVPARTLPDATQAQPERAMKSVSDSKQREKAGTWAKRHVSNTAVDSKRNQ